MVFNSEYVLCLCLMRESGFREIRKECPKHGQELIEAEETCREKCTRIPRRKWGSIVNHEKDCPLESFQRVRYALTGNVEEQLDKQKELATQIPKGIASQTPKFQGSIESLGEKINRGHLSFDEWKQKHAKSISQLNVSDNDLYWEYNYSLLDSSWNLYGDAFDKFRKNKKQ